ncbi:MAG: UPF0280 family protein [Negativicutes bacterium]|nr:UPF0280 family protein [Negativicutes bacterium]
MIEVRGPGTVRLDYGPTQMVIQAEGPGLAEGLAGDAARYAMKLIGELAAVKKAAASPQHAIGDTGAFPEVLRRMVTAVRASGDADLTPMAAVAGTVADLTAEYLQDHGATKVIVNNGGDIALRLAEGYSVEVGIAPAIDAPPTHVLTVKAGDDIGGVTTSGLGGRSFTKGIATAAVVAAKTAALADACATSIGNATFAAHPAIKLVRAEALDPLTDIAGHLVVREVGPLPPEVIQAALLGGWRRADECHRLGLICGAALFIGNFGVMIPEGFAAPVCNIQIKEGLQWKFVKS